VSIDASPPAQPPQMSPDGNWVWDGSQWQPVTGVEPTHEGVFAAYAQKVEAADQTVALAQPAAVVAPVRLAAPAMEYPYPAPAPAADYYPAADPGVPLWQQPKGSGKTVYLYVGGAVVLFLMVLIVLNTINFLSLPFIGGRTSSSPPQAAQPTATPASVTRSEFSRADVFLNGSLVPALATLTEVDRPIATCSGDFTTSCFNAITAADPPLKHALSIIDQTSIPACIADPTKNVRDDLVYMEGGLQAALKGYQDSNRSQLVDGLYRFTHFNALRDSDVEATYTAMKTRCSKEKEGP
jgi:hypothetical protein